MVSSLLFSSLLFSSLLFSSLFFSSLLFSSLLFSSLLFSSLLFSSLSLSVCLVSSLLSRLSSLLSPLLSRLSSLVPLLLPPLSSLLSSLLFLSLAGATKNSDGKRRAVGYRRRYDVQLEHTVAVGSDTTQRQRIAQTATMDVIDPSRRLRLPQEAQPILRATSVKVEKLSARCPRTARKPPGNSRHVDNSILLRVSSPTWQAWRLAASGKWA